MKHKIVYDDIEFLIEQVGSDWRLNQMKNLTDKEKDVFVPSEFPSGEKITYIIKSMPP